MILFYERDTGEIIGWIGGKKHYRGEEKFWIGNDTDRLLYDESAPYFQETLNDPFFYNKFKVNISTGFLEKKVDKL